MLLMRTGRVVFGTAPGRTAQDRFSGGTNILTERWTSCRTFVRGPHGFRQSDMPGWIETPVFDALEMPTARSSSRNALNVSITRH